MAKETDSQVKTLMSALFAAADSRDQAAPQNFADCFSEHGKFNAGGKSLTGRAGEETF